MVLYLHVYGMWVCVLVCVCERAHTCVADLQVDGEYGMRARRVFVHKRVSNRAIFPAQLHDPFTLSYTVHCVHGEVSHIHSLLWMFF